MFSAFVPLALILAAGVLFRQIPGVPPSSDVRRVIGSIVLNIFLPALTFFALYSAPLNSSLWTVPLTSAVVTLVGLGLAYVVFAVLLRRRLSRPAIGALLLASAWCNATYLGLPVVSAVVGKHVQQVPILFDLLAMTPLLFVFGTIIGVTFGHHHTVSRNVVGATGNEDTSDIEDGSVIDGPLRNTHPVRHALRQLVLLPPLWTAALGLLLNALQVHLPTELLNAFDVIGHTVSPLMIFSVGLALRMPHVRRLPFITPMVIIRLGIGAIVGWCMATALIDSRDIFRATVLESAMPCMMLTMVFAERYGLDTEVLAESVIFTTLISMLTLPLLANIL